MGAEEGRDFAVDEWADLCVVKPGDCCPDCGLPLSGSRGIEVSQVFQLGTRYSETMGATFHDEDGVEHPFIMGCYGVGVSRTVAAIVEPAQRRERHPVAVQRRACSRVHYPAYGRRRRGAARG